MGATPPTDVTRAFADWWMGDSLGLLNAAPTLLLWFGAPRTLSRGRRWLEFGGLLLITTLIGIVILGDWRNDLFGDPVPSFVLMALVVSAAIGLGRHATALLITIFFSLTLWSIRHNVGMFSPDRHYATLPNLWMFIALLSVVGMTLAIVLYQLRHTRAALHDNATNFRTLAESSSVMIWLSSTRSMCSCT